MTPDDVAKAVNTLVAPGGRLHGRVEASDPPVEVVRGKVWQAYLWPPASAGALLLRVYRIGSADSVLAALWRNEARALLRVSRRNHPVLPRIRDAFADATTGCAFLLIEDPGDPIPAQPLLVKRLEENRLEAFQAFAALAEGLALLHADGILHRALTPSAIGGYSGEALALKLDRFQMSTLMASWLRTGAADNREGAAWLGQLGPGELICIAPERLGPLLGAPMQRLEGFSADLFGLGMIVAPWFIGPIDPASAAEVVAGGVYSAAAHEGLIAAVHERLRRAGLPRELAVMLQRMLEARPANRPPSGLRVVDSLRACYGAVLAQLEADAGRETVAPYHVWFLPQTVERLYFRYHATKTHPERPDEREYSELVIEDLEGGEICWSPDGFLPWLDQEPDTNARRKAAEARIVLVGKRFAYFSQYFQDYATGTVDDRVLVIKYPCERRLVREHVATALRRAMPSVQAKYYAPPARVRLPSARSWKPLIEPLRTDTREGDSSTPVAAAEWLVDLQAGRLRAQAYDFEKLPSSTHVLLRGEWRREPDDTVDDAFEELARRVGMVGEMGNFFEECVQRAEEAGRDRPRFVVADASGIDLGVRLVYSKREDERTVRFELRGRDLVPLTGQVWLEDDAQRSLIARQRRAVKRLSTNLELVNQLLAPHSLDLAVSTTPPADVDPTTAALVQRIDGAWPFFAVQGPPGTGKTFLSALVVRSLLDREPYARVLVCAQAHNALDNLLESVAGRLGNRMPLSVRVASETTKEKVKPLGATLFPEAVARTLRDRIERTPLPSDPVQLRILKGWRAAAKERRLDIELRTRLLRSSAIMFATSAASGSKSIDPDATFDLVVVEEAARGWLTEMLVPLVRGERWLLVGDHRQLPAFEASRLQQAMKLDLDEQVTPLAGGRAVHGALVPHLTYFKHLMECDAPPTPPRAILNQQRRMHPEISRLISRTFYDGKLEDDDVVRGRRHELKADWLHRDRGLVWLDTSTFGREAWETEGTRTNDFEARLLAFVANRLAPFPRFHERIPPVTVLSPYLAQLDRLVEKRMPGIEVDDFASVDSFQGRESEVVLVSLVRFNSYEKTSKGIGFLADIERVNVMFSRARRLLVVVGALAHFSRFSETYWPTVAEVVKEREGVLIDPRTIGFTARGTQR